MMPPLVYTLRYESADRSRLLVDASRVAPAGVVSQGGRSESRYLQHLAGRAALARAFDAMGLDLWVEPEPSFGYLRCRDRQGRDLSTICVNVSHTRNVAAAVVGRASIGVDIEAADRDPGKVYRRVATDSELARLSEFCRRTGLPRVALWSAKEAFSKAVGLGISFGMRDFEIILDGSSPYSARTTLRGPLRLGDPAVLFGIEGGILTSICGERAELAGGVRWLSGPA